MTVVSQRIWYGAVVSSPSGTPLTLNETPSTPESSSTSAEIVATSATVVPLMGDVTITAGGVLSTLTGMSVDPVFPAASRATAVRVCGPSVTVRVSHAAQYGARIASLSICT